MLKNGNPARDAFSFSLDGMRTVASFTAAPAIASDRINKGRDKQLSRTRSDRDRKPRLWLRGARSVVHDNCA